ncbi:MAG: peptidase domain-containing ABC transporter [Burkholderiaceae bacterium]
MPASPTSLSSQYAILHTGNRIDAVLSASVFAHLLRLPPRYFEHRPTGVVAARLQGVEAIREFLASASVGLVLDLPFLVICLALMLYYSVPLTMIAVCILLAIAALSVIMAPIFQRRLNDQFLMGARNQAFVTEYVAGIETVKSLQMEPVLNARYDRYLAQLLSKTFATRQLGNTYQTMAQGLEQSMTVAILFVGAWYVMHPSLSPTGEVELFTVGMLVAFQMLAARLSQPMLRMVGLWQQFQQASLSVRRLGDLMNAPAEPADCRPARLADGPGRIEFAGLGFRHAQDRPWLFRGMNFVIEPGTLLTVVGPSGSGKSTLAKLLLGFYPPGEGGIRIDGVDTRQMGADELRRVFGVVPQETVLFSGSVLENLLAANPRATLHEITRACRLAEIHEVIEALPNGYQTQLGERGIGLSGGQRQRLAIARALLKRPKVLIFDESTSALDQQTAEEFARTINGLKGDVSALFIAHALPRSLHVDRIVRIQDGRVVELVRQEGPTRQAVAAAAAPVSQEHEQ